ncbi:MAG TPA: ATP-binding protein, partial [Bacteroidetes bacterium]|nr:ATP-binding protein [Bacteroidota bacterium]
MFFTYIWPLISFIMARIIGRTGERSLLKMALNTDKSELIAVYGRRRVGKTYLIRETYKGRIKFELTGLHNGTLKDQLANFHQRLSEKGHKFKRPSSWLEAFAHLERFISNQKTKKKKVIFIDEFPWLASRRSKFLMAFESFWNSYASARTDLVVVICGSAASYMVRKIIRNRGGLHNRVTQRLRLLPFNLHETQLFLKSKNIRYSSYDILQIYMAIGGIAQYLEHLRVGESVAQAVDRLCFVKDAPLKTEFLDIFASLFDNSERHSAIVRALGKSRRGFTRREISEKTKVKTGGALTRALSELEESGFIEKFPAYGHVKKNALYRLIDEYSLFYLNFIENASAKSSWLKRFNSQAFKVWSGFSFETVCLKHVEQIKLALGISSVSSENYSWTEKGTKTGAQIDLLISRNDNVINLCEMKFYNAPFTISKRYAVEIRNKIDLFQRSTQTS